MILRSVVLVAVLGLLGNGFGCGPCGEPIHDPALNVRNKTGVAVVVDYEVGYLWVDGELDRTQSQRVLELPPGERGSFSPFPMLNSCLAAPVVVRAKATGEVLDVTPEGTCLGTGLTKTVE